MGRHLVASDQAFAALKDDGSVVTWGSAVFGGDSSAVASELQQNVVEVVAASSAFAARRRDGSVVVWGDHPSSENKNTQRHADRFPVSIASGSWFQGPVAKEVISYILS